MTDLKDKMIDALKAKQSDVRNFIWKGEKKKVGNEFVQESVRLWDCELDELQKYYDHCEAMLYNEDKEHPGRYTLLKIIKDQRERCNCELFLRWLDSNVGISRFRFVQQIRDYLDNHRDEDPDIINKPITILADGVPDEFSDLKISMVLDGGLEKLGYFSRDHITLVFIVKQGICLTKEEKKELTEKTPDGKIKNRMKVIKERLLLDTPLELFSSPTGLSYEQFRAMVMLRYRKYSELTTAQLQVLRNRMLFQLEDETLKHIEQWKKREDIIIEICKLKGYDLLR